MLSFREASAESLSTHFPELGLLCAADVVTWRDQNGRLPDEVTLVTELGIAPDVASEVAAAFGTEQHEPEPGPEPEPGSGPGPEPEPERAAPQTPVPVQASDAPKAPSHPVLISEVPKAARYVTFGAEPRRSSLPAVAALLSSHPSALVSAAVAHARASLLPEEKAPPSADADLEAFVEDAPPSIITPVGPPAPEAPPEPEAPAPAVVPPRPRRALLVPTLFAVAFAANVGLAAGLLDVRSEERRAVAPIATIAADVKSLHDAEGDLRKEVHAVRAELAETRARVDKHDVVLVGVDKRADEAAEQSRAVERALRDAEARARREEAAIAKRLGRLEQHREPTVSVSDAVHMIDAMQGAPRVHE